MTDHDWVPKRRWSVRMRNFRGSLLVASPDGETNLELNDAGFLMFRAMNGARNISEIAALVADQYDIPHEMAVADVREFAEELAEENIVDLLPPTGGSPDVAPAP